MTIYIILLIQAIMASGTHIVAKVVVRDIDPVTLTFLRSVMAALGFAAILSLRSTPLHVARKDFGKIFWLSLLAIPLNQFLFLFGIKYTTPANAAFLYGTTPILVLLLSFFSRREALSWRKVLGVIISFCGILFVVFERGIDLRSEYTLGNIIMFVAVMAWALYTVHGRTLIVAYGAFPASAMTLIFGTLLYIPIGMVGASQFDFSILTTAHWMGLLYLSLITSIGAYYLWYYALGKIEASKVAIFSNMQPVLTTVLSVMILGQSITPAFLIGGAFILGGVILTQTG